MEQFHRTANPHGRQQPAGVYRHDGVTTGPVAIQTLTGTMRLKSYLAPMQSLNLREVVHINGSGTIEIVYP